MSKDSHAGKGYGCPSEVPPDHPDMLEEILKPAYREIRQEVSDEADDEENTEGRNWAILLTLFSFLLVQFAGIAMIIWAVFW
ncbi:hypothetical protein ELI49_09010 [Rhizobium ruizarguesonis]|jgi:hypothetical protein|uniref:Transmembrane protein n=1 Tax=Rhizobium ruizarguesonis TaxID=2081791 RepID=A0AAE8QBV1_9HYPH|nr:hypothetical protein [Rhizobium ruizarguesonis]MBY5880395.1 hypothetical protein [Rhizobium leguminosarum]NKK60956.1 hypothetical protein [Rhizobium leguminosarum bv. viciae]QIO43741.1 hypothetical protein HA464_06855 [Rhizobium leguminosarum bv. trifolii]MBY5892967.1 hypothetical protein [Rhizobium leguminosarum]NEH31628.1 hypothetical protein [Rhizobium ruizarguesonis]